MAPENLVMHDHDELVREQVRAEKRLVSGVPADQCINCLEKFKPTEHKSALYCDACFDQKKAATEAAQRLQGYTEEARRAEKAAQFGQRYGASPKTIGKIVGTFK